MRTNLQFALMVFAALMLSQRSLSQNSVQLDWGYTTSSSKGMHQAFGGTERFAAGFFHPLNKQLEMGIQWNREHYLAQKDFFQGAGYDGNFYLHYFTAAARYHFVQSSQWQAYAGLNAGVNRINLKEKKDGSYSEERKTGYSAGVSAGVEAAVSRRIWLGAGMQYHLHKTGHFNFDNRLAMDHLSNIGAGISLRFLLHSRQPV